MAFSVSDDFTKATRARKTVCEMLKDRGYTVDGTDLEEWTVDDLRNRFGIGSTLDSASRSKLLLIVNRPKGENEDGIIVFFPPGRLGIKSVKDFIAMMLNVEIYHAIIVTQNDETPQARKAIEQSSEGTPEPTIEKKSPPIRFEQFKEEELQINITRHVLVPKHEALSEEEKTKFLTEQNLQLSQIPRILRSDPVSRYYDFSEGQIIKITRNTGDGDFYITYRIVV
jgi:DNA-directed RNA polymerases I, II, and III subunit RPABC1